MKMFEFNQNNSGGGFDVDDKVCHRVFIEANNEEEANEKASELGIYFYGVDSGRDCDCCGDRWRSVDDDDDVYEDLKRWSTEGYEVFPTFGNTVEEAIEEFREKYSDFSIVDGSLRTEKSYNGYSCTAKLKFNTVEDYAVYLAQEYGWTSPDSRIFYANGTIVEIGE